MFTDEQLKCAGEGDLASLIELDKKGFCIGTGESSRDYVERLRYLQQNIADLESCLADSGKYELEGIEFQQSEKIEQERFLEVADITDREYAFQIDWVPGFYKNPANSWLFGGCAFYFFPDFFVLFLLRKSFAENPKWWIYDRRELLAHELCHIARIGITDGAYEEHFAYRLSFSGFRRIVGGVFHSAKDSFALLGVTFALLLAQIMKVLLFPALWLWPFWIFVVAVIGFFAVRHAYNCHRLSKAGRVLQERGVMNPWAALFRMSGEEIKELAGIQDEDSFNEWRAQKCDLEIRWKVIDARFISSGNVE
ncbi:MAG: hypothetical protein ACOCZS_01310 [Verrucomicrobiota bacterium]